jgi:hypothetical protein
MKRRTVTLALSAIVAAPRVALAATKEESQAEVRKAAQDALAAVYKVAPSARKAAGAAAGYAAFSNFGMKILMAGGGTGKGIAVNNKTRATTYMKMAELQAGLGFGVKKFQLLWVFENRAGAEQFRQLRLGDRRPGYGVGEVRRQGRRLSGRRQRLAGCLAVPGERRQSGARTDSQGNQVFHGQ